jgi:hypothetical protein
MRADVGVFMAVILGQPFGLGQRTDLLDVEQIVAQAAVEAFDVGVFLIDQRQPFQATPVAGLVKNEVVAPNVVATLSLEPAGAVLSTAEAAIIRPLRLDTLR